MRADCRVILDACVLIPMPLADTLLRMAEAPRLYLPKWSQTILDEVTRMELRRHFPEARVEGFEALTDAMTNDPADRHVLASAVGLPLSRLLDSLAKNVPQFVDYFREEQGIESR